MANKFKVGDKARSLRDGITVEIVECSPTDHTYKVLHNKHMWWMGESRLGEVPTRSTSTSSNTGSVLNTTSQAYTTYGNSSREQDPAYCSCVIPKIIRTSTSVHSKPTDDNSYDYCTNCKKERK